jgi:glutamate carboxypeptidase
MGNAVSFSLEAMIDDVSTLVTSESPSRDIERLNASAQLLSEMMTRLLGHAPRIIDSPVGPHVHWSGGGEPKVLILGHHDTVHPLGTLQRIPFSYVDDVLRGPGVFDMKAGIVQALHGVAALDDASHIEILLTADEEIGSKASKDLLIERARACGAVLVLEPSADGGALKVGRKGTGTFFLTIEGRASHAGLEPEKGVNSLMELAQLLPQIAALSDVEKGTTVSPTLAQAGTADNVIPAQTTCAVDVRVAIPEEKPRVEAGFAALTLQHPEARLAIEGGIGRPPMHHYAAATLFEIARNVARSIDLGDIEGLVVGGGSDGNFTADAGVETLDGLGAVGGGAHGDSEHVIASTMPQRAALIGGLCQELSSMAKRPPLGSVPDAR